MASTITRPLGSDSKPCRSCAGTVKVTSVALGPARRTAWAAVWEIRPSDGGHGARSDRMDEALDTIGVRHAVRSFFFSVFAALFATPKGDETSRALLHACLVCGDRRARAGERARTEPI